MLYNCTKSYDTVTSLMGPDNHDLGHAIKDVLRDRKMWGGSVYRCDATPDGKKFVATYMLRHPDLPQAENCTNLLGVLNDQSGTKTGGRRAVTFFVGIMDRATGFGVPMVEYTADRRDHSDIRHEVELLAGRLPDLLTSSVGWVSRMRATWVGQDTADVLLMRASRVRARRRLPWSYLMTVDRCRAALSDPAGTLSAWNLALAFGRGAAKVNPFRQMDVSQTFFDRVLVPALYTGAGATAGAIPHPPRTAPGRWGERAGNGPAPGRSAPETGKSTAGADRG